MKKNSYLKRSFIRICEMYHRSLEPNAKTDDFVCIQKFENESIGLLSSRSRVVVVSMNPIIGDEKLHSRMTLAHNYSMKTEWQLFIPKYVF